MQFNGQHMMPSSGYQFSRHKRSRLINYPMSPQMDDVTDHVMDQMNFFMRGMPMLRRKRSFGLSDSELGGVGRSKYSNFFDTNQALKRQMFIDVVDISPELEGYRGIYHGPDHHSDVRHHHNLETGDIVNSVARQDSYRSQGVSLPFAFGNF